MTNNKNTQYEPIPVHVEEIAKNILDAAFQVHSALGPGLLESVYETCMLHELNLRNIAVRSHVSLPVTYKGITVDAGYRLDLLVYDCVVVELKSVEAMNPVYYAQLLTYIKLVNKRLGLLINFNAVHLCDGIKRIIS